MMEGVGGKKERTAACWIRKKWSRVGQVIEIKIIDSFQFLFFRATGQCKEKTNFLQDSNDISTENFLPALSTKSLNFNSQNTLIFHFNESEW